MAVHLADAPLYSDELASTPTSRSLGEVQSALLTSGVRCRGFAAMADRHVQDGNARLSVRARQFAYMNALRLIDNIHFFVVCRTSHSPSKSAGMINSSPALSARSTAIGITQH